MSTLTYQQIKQLATQQMKKQEAIARQSDMLNIAELNERYYAELAHGTVLCHADNRKGSEWEDHSYLKKEWNAKRGAYDYIYDTSSAKSQANREASDRTAYERQKALSTYGGNPITRTPFTNVNYSVNKPAQSTNNQNSGSVMPNAIKLMNPQINDMLAAKQAREQHEYKKTFAANSNAEGLKRAQAGQYNPGAANSLNSSVQQTTGRNIANMMAKNGTTSGNSANSLNSEIQRSAGRDEEAKARAAGKTHADTMNKMMLQTQANRELPMKNGVTQRLSNAPGEQAQGQAMQAKQMSDAELSKMAGRENNYNMQSRSLTPDQQRERDRQLAISRQNNANMQSRSLTPDQQREIARQQNVARQNQYNIQSQSLTPDQQREASRQQNVARQNQYNMQSRSLTPDQQREASRQQKENNLSEKFRIYDNNALNESSRKYGEIARNGGIDSAVKATMQDQTVKNLLDVLPDAVRNGEIKITTGKDGKVEYSGTKDAVDYMNKVADWLDSVSKNAGSNRSQVREKLEEAIDKEIKLAVSKGSVQNKGQLRPALASDGDSQSDRDYANKLTSALKGNLNYDEKNQSKGLSEAIAMNTKSTGPNRSDDISGKDLADALRNNVKTQDATNDRLYAEKRAANKNKTPEPKGFAQKIAANVLSNIFGGNKVAPVADKLSDTLPSSIKTAYEKQNKPAEIDQEKFRETSNNIGKQIAKNGQISSEYLTKKDIPNETKLSGASNNFTGQWHNSEDSARTDENKKKIEEQKKQYNIQSHSLTPDQQRYATKVYDQITAKTKTLAEQEAERLAKAMTEANKKKIEEQNKQREMQSHSLTPDQQRERDRQLAKEEENKYSYLPDSAKDKDYGWKLQTALEYQDNDRKELEKSIRSENIDLLLNNYMNTDTAFSLIRNHPDYDKYEDLYQEISRNTNYKEPIDTLREFLLEVPEDYINTYMKAAEILLKAKNVNDFNNYKKDSEKHINRLKEEARHYRQKVLTKIDNNK